MLAALAPSLAECRLWIATVKSSWLAPSILLPHPTQSSPRLKSQSAVRGKCYRPSVWVRFSLSTSFVKVATKGPSCSLHVPRRPPQWDTTAHPTLSSWAFSVPIPLPVCSPMPLLTVSRPLTSQTAARPFSFSVGP